MRILFFDILSGICGDMVLASFVNAGATVEHLEAELGKTGLPAFRIRASRVERSAISATAIRVETADGGGARGRSYQEIAAMIDGSGIGSGAKERAQKVYRRLAEAEAVVHNHPLAEVHFHEVASTAALVNVIGSAICIESFGVEAVYSTPVMIGSGTCIQSSHGNLPSPAPATLEVLRNYPVSFHASQTEITTPTGAAIIAGLSHGLLPSPFEMTVEKIGYGAGSHQIPGLPNLLRVVLGHWSV